ncbi:LPXTG cell wall anchor domain-containing protein [Corynebacterium aquatimens]|nr:LPXTG cell wall anchor domain-containing protein [Corynebacterium aquatimens]QYH19207.1 LPXTG cell wall anchor domain-containing protein [Corynebacterium aquatimens]
MNLKSPNTLPNTGGMGVVVLALAGLTIVGGGIYAARRNSKAA